MILIPATRTHQVMRSKTHPDFWDAYYQLPKTIQTRAAVVYKRWRKNPDQPGLSFKPVKGKALCLFSPYRTAVESIRTQRRGYDHLVLDRPTF